MTHEINHDRRATVTPGDMGGIALLERDPEDRDLSDSGLFVDGAKVVDVDLNDSTMDVMRENDKEPIATPNELRLEHPLLPEAKEMIEKTRHEAGEILAGDGQRKLLIVGPCSLDDSQFDNGTYAVLELAKQIKAFSEDPTIAEKSLVIMRAPPVKPRTDLGWSGLDQTDPNLAHKLLTDITNLGIPVAIEASVNTLSAYEDMLGMAWVGARENKSTSLRQLLSGLGNLPVLVKNSHDQHGFEDAVKAIRTIIAPHLARVIDGNGRLCNQNTKGVKHTGIIYRGNDGASVGDFERVLKDDIHAIDSNVVVDVSHGNTMAHDSNGKKSVEGQQEALDHLLELLKEGRIDDKVVGIMIELNLFEGRSDDKLPGVSITDPCISMKDLYNRKESLCV